MSAQITKHVLTPAAAQEFVRKARGKTLFVSVGQWAPVHKPESGFPVTGHIPVTRKNALKFLADVYPETLADKGAMCVISTLNNCVFIGQSASVRAMI